MSRPNPPGRCLDHSHSFGGSGVVDMLKDLSELGPLQQGFCARGPGESLYFDYPSKTALVAGVHSK